MQAFICKNIKKSYIILKHNYTNSCGNILELKKDYIYNLLRRSILDGTLPPGHRLPPEVSLAKELQVGQVTLRGALAKLEKEGLVERVRSRGTFVSEKFSGKVFLFIIPDGTEDLETPFLKNKQKLKYN